MSGSWGAFGYAAIGAALLVALGACSSDKPANPSDASDNTITGLDQRDRTYRVTPTGANEFELRIVTSGIFRATDNSSERRERARAMRLILQAKCQAGRTAEIADPQDGTVARGRCV